MSAAPPPFYVLIPARLGSSRLPEKPLADLHGVPMVVRVARQAAASGAQGVVVCADSARIVSACENHGVRAILTLDTHATGTDRLAEACEILHLEPHAIVVNVQGDEPLIPPEVIRRVAMTLAEAADCALATAAHRLHAAAEFFDPNVVKVVLNGRGRALLFSRAPIPWARDAFTQTREVLPPELPALRHVGLYAYRTGFLAQFCALPRPAVEECESLEQLRALYHGHAIAVLQLDAPLPPGVDTQADLERARQAIAAAHNVSHQRVHHAPAEDRP